MTPANRTPSLPLLGNSAPPFSLLDPAIGDTVSLSDFAGRDVLLVFLRGTWCPYCVQQLRVLKENFATIQAAQVAVIAVACQSRFTVKLFLGASPLPFPLLCDGSRAVAKAYGTHYLFSHEGFNLSHPALFILDRAHRVSFAHVGRGMNDLPISAILEKFVALLAPDNNAPEAA